MDALAMLGDGFATAWATIVDGLAMAWSTIAPHPLLWAPGLAILLLLLVLGFPMPGRGPRTSRRDPWRTFKFAPRAAVLQRAGGRCEGSVLLMWGRCDEPATDVDHVYPWSKGGPTIASNGQALCRGHNRNKSAMTPPWWYIRTLERRRRDYAPAGVSIEVRTTMSAEDRAARERSAARRPR